MFKSFYDSFWSLLFELFIVLYQLSLVIFFLMIRRPPRSTLDRSSAASDVYKRQVLGPLEPLLGWPVLRAAGQQPALVQHPRDDGLLPVSYTHLRAHEPVLDLVCRLLLEKKHHIVLPSFTCPNQHIYPNITVQRNSSQLTIHVF